MNNVNNLLEGASPYQVLQEQAGKLASKWEKSGLLEGISSSTDKSNMAMLLENQAKQLVNEANTTGTGTSITTGNSEAWAGVALPLVRRVFGEIVAKDLVSVQPMNLPAGLIFYLDFQYGQDGNFKSADESLYGAAGSGTDTIKRTDGSFDKGLYGAGEFGYSVSESAVSVTATNATASFSGILNFDTEFSSSKGGLLHDPNTLAVRMLKVEKLSLSGSDLDAVRSFQLVSQSNATDLVCFPQFTRVNGDYVEFVVSGANAATEAVTVSYLLGPDNLNDRGDFEDGSGTAAASGGVSTLDIPEINVRLISDTVAAKTRKLKA